MDETEMRQGSSGELCRAAAVSRLETCARSVEIAQRINSLCGSDVYRINVLARAAEEWRRATVLTYASPSHPRRDLGFSGKAKDDM